jgi:hypothetical protein
MAKIWTGVDQCPTCGNEHGTKMQCEACKIVGCQKCLGGFGRCKKCGKGRVLPLK